MPPNGAAPWKLDRSLNGVSGRTRTALRLHLIMKWFAVLVLAAALIAAFIALKRIANQIQQQSTVDEEHPADAILVLGAAEYRGKPSPVLEARLNHALFLYLKGMAPHIITTGGAGGDPVFTEGTVSRTYLTQRGVPPEAIIVEREGSSTVQSVATAAEIMEQMNFHSVIVVSDGYHIFRVKHMLESKGVQVYGSPRPSREPSGWHGKWLYFRQAIGYSLWRLGVPV